jgi:hypothetical protein
MEIARNRYIRKKHALFLVHAFFQLKYSYTSFGFTETAKAFADFDSLMKTLHIISGIEEK